MIKFLICKQKVPGSNVAWEADYLDWDFSCLFSVSPGKFQRNKPGYGRPLPYLSSYLFPIQLSDVTGSTVRVIDTVVKQTAINFKQTNSSVTFVAAGEWWQEGCGRAVATYMGIRLKVLRKTTKTSVKIVCAPAEILMGHDKDKLQWLSPEQTCAIYADSYVYVIRNSSFILPHIKTRHDVSNSFLFCRRQMHVIACPFSRVQLYPRFVRRSASLPPTKSVSSVASKWFTRPGWFPPSTVIRK